MAGVQKMDLILANLDDGAAVGRSLRTLWIACAGRCVHCGQDVQLSQAARRLLVPVSQGGLERWENMRLAHKRCNQLNASKAIVDAPPFAAPSVLYQVRSVNNSGGERRNRVGRLYAKYGADCYLCGAPTKLTDAARIRVTPSWDGGGWDLANLRLTHRACATKLNTARQRARAQKFRRQRRLNHRRHKTALHLGRTLTHCG